MGRIKALNRYQKAILIIMLVIVLAFIVPFSTVVTRVGYEYKDSILVPALKNGSTVYSGTVRNQPVSFTVSADKTVVFQLGDKTYGPYTVKEDATAIPDGHNMGPGSTGIELKRGEDILFRGVAQRIDDFWWLVDENGDSPDAGYWVTVNGVTKDEYGNIIDPKEPSVSTILDLMNDPLLTHKGSWAVWLCGVFVCIVATVSILYADELFVLRLAFRVRNAEYAEPSELEIAGRYVAWTLFPICALVIFIMGLQ